MMRQLYQTNAVSLYPDLKLQGLLLGLLAERNEMHPIAVKVDAELSRQVAIAALVQASVLESNLVAYLPSMYPRVSVVRNPQLQNSNDRWSYAIMPSLTVEPLNESGPFLDFVDGAPEIVRQDTLSLTHDQQIAFLRLVTSPAENSSEIDFDPDDFPLI